MARRFGCRRLVFAVIVAVPAADAATHVAFAQQAGATAQAASENLMKVCGDRWRALKAADAANGLTWTRFLSRCRAEMVGRAPAAALTEASPAPSTSASRAAPQVRETPVRQAESGARASNVVFPDFVSPRYAGEAPHRARLKTCSAQFQANKATGGNGGLPWARKGGGYWSQCNARLKQPRA